ENSRADHRVQIGSTVEVLVEGPSRRELAAHSPGLAPGLSEPGASPGLTVKQLTGRSMTDHIVVFDGTDRLIGQTVRVAIRDASPFTLYGDIVLASGGGEPLVAGEAKNRGLTPPARQALARPGRFSLPLV